MRAEDTPRVPVSAGTGGTLSIIYVVPKRMDSRSDEHLLTGSGRSTRTDPAGYPNTIEDPSTGASITFLEHGADERGAYLLMDGVLPPGTDSGPARLHPQSEVRSENKLFATLRPTTRKLRYPREQEIIFNDTVGFIHELPADLVAAFRATLEELYTADLLIHLVDVSAENFEDRMSSVNQILRELELDEKEQILAFNKIDRIDEEAARSLAETYGAIPISAVDMESTLPLIDELKARLLSQSRRGEAGTWAQN